MNLPNKIGLAALACAALGATAPAYATDQAAGPVQVGPSWAQADAAHSAAALSTIIANQGPVADRLIRIACPASGHVALRNGAQHQDIETPNLAQARQAEATNRGQYGLDLPPALHGAVHPVTAQIDLSQATQPLTDGATIPCTVTFAHAGEQIVLFTVGEQPHPTDEP